MLRIFAAPQPPRAAAATPRPAEVRPGRLQPHPPGRPPQGVRRRPSSCPRTLGAPARAAPAGATGGCRNLAAPASAPRTASPPPRSLSCRLPQRASSRCPPGPVSSHLRPPATRNSTSALEAQLLQWMTCSFPRDTPHLMSLTLACLPPGKLVLGWSNCWQYFSTAVDNNFHKQPA